MIHLLYDNQAQESDINRNSGNILTDETFETAVYISLFTRRKALDDDELPDTRSHREGWWADEYADIENDFIGSRLWLLSREGATNATMATAKVYIQEALQWMIDDGIAESIDVIVERQQSHCLVFQVNITRPNKIAPRWQSIWTAHLELL
jgi:phage gp46-like protein